MTQWGRGTRMSRYNRRIAFGLAQIPPQDIYAKIVERCGDRKYWESWAKDVADIFQRVVVRIENLLNNPDNDALREWFDAFHTELREAINASITRADAIDMMAQHLLTRPVFEALFENYDFASGNPVSIALDNLRKDFGEFGLDDETRDLEGFYESVRMRARGIDNSEGRQRVLLELYEKFFATALKKDAERLGIVYTPVEVVDFILHSANDVLQQEFGRSLSDEGVHVLDPFAGAGVFLARLLQSGLIRASDLERKYREELHANEIVLLAYYIAAVNIEEAYSSVARNVPPPRNDLASHNDVESYTPFSGIVLTDTFNLNKKGEPPTLFPKEWLPDNNARAERQQKLPIQVIIGNPPWVGGQKSSADNNPNVYYPSLTKRIRKTYGANLKAKGEKHLYNTYKMAIRWASDRIKGQGVIGFVTSGSWIDKGIDAGLRACLTKEFSSIYVLNLRGDAYTSGERRRAEGGNVFKEGSRAIVAITILVKNPNAAGDGCRIYYRDIGDNLKSEEKLAILKEAHLISGFTDWQEVIPDQYHDWIRQRSPEFDQFYALGSENSKKGLPDDTIFSLYSLGRQTTKDLYVYNFSRASCIENARKMTEDYLAAISDLETNPELSVAEASRRHSSNIMWVSNLMKKLERKHRTEFDEAYIRKIMFRPFIPTYCYTDNTFAISMYQMGRIFPNSSSENRVICVPGIGSEAPFSALITDTMPDRHFNEACQCYPRYSYPKPPKALDTTDKLPGIERESDRIDNISDIALNAFRKHYPDDAITKDAIFDYVYGVLHSPTYREKFANDLSKVLPRIPFAPDFHTFAKAGGELATLHLGYETCEQYPIDITSTHQEESEPKHFLIDERGMRFADNEETTLIINDYVKLSGIPAEAHRYIINGKTPLEWFIERYQINRERGVHNDPNGWFADPRDLVTAIERIVHVSVESTRIIEGLPSQLTDDLEG